MHLVLIGYFPKRYTPRPDGLDAPRVREICSVSECIASGPDGWLERWSHNDMWAYNSVREAWAVALPEADASAWRMHAYRLLPVEFVASEHRPFEIPKLDVEALPANFESLGFDIVSRSNGALFECSPLSCNYLAEEATANEYCLMSTLADAVRVAGEFARGEPEPGPYFVIEVLRSNALLDA